MGISIRTISEGEIEEMAVGLKGMMNPVFLRETCRGTVGLAQEGRHAGGRVHGYHIRRQFDAAGEDFPSLQEIDVGDAKSFHPLRRRVFAAGHCGRCQRARPAEPSGRVVERLHP